MVTAEVVPAESGRYAASLLIVPGLWAGPRGWRGFASYLAHRGWECHLLAMREGGGIHARAAEIADYAVNLPARPVVMGHDAGALVALAAAEPARARAVIAVAPLVPARPELRDILATWRAVLTLALGRPLARPTGEAAHRFWRGLSAVGVAQVCEAEHEEGRFVREFLAARHAPVSRCPVPALLVAGAADPLLPIGEAGRLAERLGADLEVLGDAGHWPYIGPRWSQAVGLVHRWLVRGLGEPLLERYAEAMAERDDAED